MEALTLSKEVGGGRQEPEGKWKRKQVCAGRAEKEEETRHICRDGHSKAFAMGRWSGIIPVGPEYHHKCPDKRGRRRSDTEAGVKGKGGDSENTEDAEQDGGGSF